MSLEDVVTINITKQAATFARVGFGVPLCMVYHTVTPHLLRAYNSVKALTDEGFPVYHPAVQMATRIFAQNPRVRQIYIGKRSLPFTQTVEIYPTVTTEGYTYSFQYVDASQVVTDIEYTVPNSATIVSVCTALAALISPLNDSTTTANPTNVSIVATVGKLFDLRSLPNPDHLKIKDVTVDPGISTDLTAIEALDASSWYGVLLDYGGKATTVAAAAWVEARRKLFGYDITDQECTDNVITNDVFSTLKTTAYARTFGRFSQRRLLSYSAAGWIGKMFPFQPGASNWAFQTIAGVDYDLLTPGQETNLLAKNANIYTPLAGANSTQYGKTASGEWIDITHGCDWLQSDLSIRVFGPMKAASDAGKKIGMTDSGVDTLRAAVLAGLYNATTPAINFLRSDPAPTVTFPKVSELTAEERAQRRLPRGEFTAQFTGAVNGVDLTGYITP